MSFPTAPAPSLFLSHGAPNFLLYDSDTRDAWRRIAKSFAPPAAILIMSAHFCAAAPSFGSDAAPATLHDFSGFEPILHAMNYRAPGAPALAAQAATLARNAGIAAGLSSARGYDHGVWVPLAVMYPDADVPVVTLSVQPARDAAAHFRLGRALSSLRAQNVLIIGSGGLTHNLAAFATGDEIWPPARAFADWAAQSLEAGDVEALLDWERAPEARVNHPTPEHFLPLAFALGAGGGSAGRSLHRAMVGPMALDAYGFG